MNMHTMFVHTVFAILDPGNPISHPFSPLVVGDSCARLLYSEIHEVRCLCVRRVQGALLQALAQFLSTQYRSPVHVASLMISNGISQSLDLVVGAFCSPGDVVRHARGLHK